MIINRTINDSKILLFFGSFDALIEEMEQNIDIKHDSKHDSTEDSINSDLNDGSKSNSDLSSIDTKVDQLEECEQLWVKRHQILISIFICNCFTSSANSLIRKWNEMKDTNYWNSYWERVVLF